MTRFENTLEELQQRPAMFTGENTLTAIHLFLVGYSFALMQHEVPTDDDPLVLPCEFHDWVAYRLHYYESTSGWCNMICNRTKTDQEAIDTFFRLLAEFKERIPHVVAKLINFQKTYRTATISRDESGKVVRSASITKQYPESISLVTYTDDPGFYAYSDTEDEDADEDLCEEYFPDLESFELRTGADRSQLTILDNDWNPQPFQGDY